MEYITAILTVLLKFGADWFKGWYESEKAIADQWAQKTKDAQLESVKRAHMQQAEIKQVESKKVDSPADWNRFMLILLLLCPMCLSGCFTRYVYVESARPIIEAPKRPKIPANPPTWTDRERMLADYALALESVLEAYNKQAEAVNKANGY